MVIRSCMIPRRYYWNSERSHYLQFDLGMGLKLAVACSLGKVQPIPEHTMTYIENKFKTPFMKFNAEAQSNTHLINYTCLSKVGRGPGIS